jgi:hypothetical protein
MESELKASIDSYSKAWTLPYVTDMYEHIKREVRDMIYTQIWDTEYLGTPGSRKMRNHATSSDNFRSEEFPHVIRLEFVGYEVAREVVEAWYQAVVRPEEDSRALEVSWISGGALKRVISQDIFKLCVIPATVLRKLHLSFLLNLYRCTKPLEGSRSSETQSRGRRRLSPSTRSRGSSGFN